MIRERNGYRDGDGKAWLTIQQAAYLACLNVDDFVREVLTRSHRFPRRDVRLGEWRTEFRRSTIERWFGVRS
ncbi:MAG: hypothetical protein FD180_1813 [Planctomycetota bacterium]|nr:MAG: hypothetical protein FD180_1813 [Planctomycetota bacterium]